jgi:hypothetical protein
MYRIPHRAFRIFYHTRICIRQQRTVYHVSITLLPLLFLIKPKNKHTTENIKKTNLKHISTTRHSTTRPKPSAAFQSVGLFPRRPAVRQSDVFLSAEHAYPESRAEHSMN